MSTPPATTSDTLTLAVSETSLARPSQDSTRPSVDSHGPSTPRFGSLRSILRERDTPGSGSKVRFFSRDAYKTVSPNSSKSSTGPDDLSFLTRLNGKNTAPSRADSSARLSARDVFASMSQEEHPHAIDSMISPVPPPDNSNIFDMSQENDIPTIAPANSVLMDNAVELHDELQPPFDDDPTTTTPYRPDDETAFFSPAADTPSFARSRSFTFGQHPVFSPPGAGDHSPAPSLISDHRSSKSSSNDNRSSKASSTDSASLKINTKSRSRALSDTVFHRMVSGSSTSVNDLTTETDANDKSAALVVYSSQQPDPFCVDATAYYAPGGIMPPTPPPQSMHTRKASREEDMNWTLRTQLALQQDLCAQYEIDLAARDELVNALSEKLELSDREREKRSSVLRGWKKKVQELEKVCRNLEQEVDKSRQDSLERSVLDEASGESLRSLHRVISEMEREKAEEKSRRDSEVESLREELRKYQEGENEQSHRDAQAAWTEERAQLVAQASELQGSSEELHVLKSELEAQWKNTETMSEQITSLTSERNSLKQNVEHIEKRITNMQVDWNYNENRRLEAETEFQELVSEKNDASAFLYFDEYVLTYF